MKHAGIVLGLALSVSACETVPVGDSRNEPPANSIDLGDWGHGAPAVTLTQFQSVVTSRYAAGGSVSSAAADLRRNDFTCAENVDSTGRGTPPAEICRKTLTAENCTGTWQVHFFEMNGDGRIQRARALFDRRCGREGLLGGPS